MEQRFGLTRATRASTGGFLLHQRWMRFFFAEEHAASGLRIIDLQRRAVWIGLALLCQALLLIIPDFPSGRQNAYAWYMPLLELLAALIPVLLTLGSFCALWLALKPATLQQQLELARQHGARWQKMNLLRTIVLTLIGCVLLIITVVQCFLPPEYTNDGTLLDTNAAQLLLQGKNPYTSSNILDIAHHFAVQPGWTTPLRRGQFAGQTDYPGRVDLLSAFDTALKAHQAPEFESRVSYPDLSFLTLVPFVLLNISNVLPFYLLCYLALVWIAWKVVHRELRPWLVLLALADLPMWTAAISGSLDLFYILLITLAWLTQERRMTSLLFLGLALASKQLAWFFVPFYLILIWRQQSFRETCLRVILAGILALALNLPFVLWDPSAWLAGVLAPMADPMFPEGVGLVNLSAYHLFPYLPSWGYLSLEAGAMAAMLVYYWRCCRKCPEAAFLLATLPLFLAWRSLPSYFSCAAFPIFLLLAARARAYASSPPGLVPT